MAVIARKDGIQFVTQPYRELLDVKSSGLLKREIKLLSEEYGGYARIFRQDSKHLEAVFSRDLGYLLGETVWHYFDKPDDLLYCEALPENGHALVVVVRDRRVYLDAKVQRSQMAEELASLHIGSGTFAVYVFGDVPVSQEPRPNAFCLEPERIKSFTRLTTSAFDKLPERDSLNLIDVDNAIAELKLDRRAHIVMGTVATVIIVGVVGTWLMHEVPVEIAKIETVEIAPLQAYSMALQQPDPMLQINELTQQIMLLHTIPGWLPTDVTYSSKGAQFKVHSLGSPLTVLLQWAKTNHVAISFSADGATASLPSLVTTLRPAPQAIAKTLNAEAAFIDGTMRVLPGKSVQLGSTISKGLYSETTLTINFTNISPDVLKLIAKTWVGLPVNLTGCTFTLDNGLISGNIQLTLLGN